MCASSQVFLSNKQFPTIDKQSHINSAFLFPIVGAHMISWVVLFAVLIFKINEIVEGSACSCESVEEVVVCILVLK